MVLLQLHACLFSEMILAVISCVFLFVVNSYAIMLIFDDLILHFHLYICLDTAVSIEYLVTERGSKKEKMKNRFATAAIDNENWGNSLHYISP